MLADAFVFLALYLLSLAGVLVTGSIILRLFGSVFEFGEARYSRLFVSLFFGFAGLSTLHALFRSGLSTVSLLLPLLFLMAFYKRNAAFLTRSRATAFPRYAYLLLMALLPFAFFCCILYKGGDFFYGAVDYDSVIYSRLSDQLKNTGIESRWLNYFADPEMTAGPEPYHYFDLWFNALVCRVSGTGSLTTLFLVTYPLLITISCCGILAIAEHIGSVNPLHVGVAIILIFIGPVYAVQHSSVGLNTTACELPMQRYGEKFAVHYPFILFGLLLVLNRQMLQALLITAGLCIVSASTFPGIALFCFLFVLIRRRQAWAGALTLRLIVLFGALVIFYTLRSPGGNTTFGHNFLPAAALNYKGHLVQFFSAAANTLFRFLVNYFYAIPLLLYVMFNKRRHVPRDLLLFLLAPLAALVASLVLYRVRDSYQLFTNLLPVFHCVLIVLFLLAAEWWKQNKKALLCFYAFLGLNALAQTWYIFADYRNLQRGAGLSDDYMLRLSELDKRLEPGARLAHLFSQQDFSRLMTQPNANYLYHLAYTHFDPRPLNLSCVDISGMDSLEKIIPGFLSLNEKEPFYRYFNAHIREAGQSPERMKLAFLQQQHVKHILLGPTTATPFFVKRLVLDSVTDKKTGVKLLILK